MTGGGVFNLIAHWQELLAAREAYELGCLLSVAKEDIPGCASNDSLTRASLGKD